ncbi:hypothetical protein KCU93_g267, partial [Aureobasidium melanogenum]
MSCAKTVLTFWPSLSPTRKLEMTSQISERSENCINSSRNLHSALERRFVLEAQLENLTEKSVVLERVTVSTAQGLTGRSLNWNEADERPMLNSQDVMQVAFTFQQILGEQLEEKNGRTVLAQLHVDWKSQNGEMGSLTTADQGSWLVTTHRVPVSNIIAEIFIKLNGPAEISRAPQSSGKHGGTSGNKWRGKEGSDRNGEEDHLKCRIRS